MPIFGGTLALLIPVLSPIPLARELGIEAAVEVTPMDGVVPGEEEKDIVAPPPVPGATLIAPLVARGTGLIPCGNEAPYGLGEGPLCGLAKLAAAVGIPAGRLVCGVEDEMPEAVAETNSELVGCD